MTRFGAVTILLSVVALCHGNIDIAPTIVGGRNATLGQFPYMASLQVVGQRLHGCGAGILNERWLLGAAHCFPIDVDWVVAVVGTITFDEGGVVYPIERLIRHPEYQPSIDVFGRLLNVWNDIGVIKTRTRIVFNEFTQPIPIGRRHLLSNVPVTLAGFGMYEYGTPAFPPPQAPVMSRNLQYMEARTMSYTECMSRMFNYLMNNPLNSYFVVLHPMLDICIRAPRNTGFCFGDSGSILVANGEAAGVVVGKSGACGGRSPQFFSRVSSYVDWIDSHIRDLN